MNRSKMLSARIIVLAILLEILGVVSSEVVIHNSAHHVKQHRPTRKYREIGIGGELRFDRKPFGKKIELHTAGKIHCKVAGGIAPKVDWYLNDNDPLPEGLSSANGTLVTSNAEVNHTGEYTCRATDGGKSIQHKIKLDVVVSPKITEPLEDQQVHVTENTDVWLNCIASGVPPPTTHWDRNLSILSAPQDDNGDGNANSTDSNVVLFPNGTLWLRSVSQQQSDQYACTAGSAAGMVRHNVYLTVHPQGEQLPQESTGVAGKAVLVSISVAGAYMILVLALMVYCRRRRLKRRERGEKMELEMAEGREKLVEDEEEAKVNGTALNGRLLAQDRDSGADNSESCVSRASKRSGQFDQFALPRSMITDQITLGRGEFGEVILAKMDIVQLKKLRNKEANKDRTDTDLRPVLVKALSTTDEVQLVEFRRQLELFSRVRQENIVRLLGLCNDAEPHYMILEHTDWGSLKQFLEATRTEEERAEYASRVGPANTVCEPQRHAPPLKPAHAVSLGAQLSRAAAALAHRRLTHRDIAARNCVISSKLHLKLSMPALTRGPHSHEYFKHHDQVIPLRWLPTESVVDGEYSTKSDVYMYAVTVWEIFTKAELPFAKLNDNSVLDRITNGTLEWSVPDCMPDKVASLLKKCWSKLPSERPHFEQISDDMNVILQEYTSENVSKKSFEDISDAIKEE